MSGHFCFDDMPTLADCVLVPQVFSARRFNVDVSKYPRVAAIDALCNTLPAFISASEEPARFRPDRGSLAVTTREAASGTANGLWRSVASVRNAR